MAAQENSDIGIFAGTSYYMGDLNSALHYAAPNLAVGAIYRYNFNFHNALRFHAFYHGLSGTTQNFTGDISQLPGGIFNANFVDLGLDFEFNWERYKTATRRTKSSPYVFAGIAYGRKLSGTPEVSSNIISIPFGLGYKINLGPWLSGGVEFSARKSFSDRVDGVANPDPGMITPFGNKDWYYFSGVFLTYKIFKFWEDCPAYDDD